MLTAMQRLRSTLDYAAVDIAVLEDLADDIAASDTLLVTGSSLTGLSRRQADLDLLVLGSCAWQSSTQAASLHGAARARYRLPNLRHVTLRYIHADTLHALQARVQRTQDGFCVPSLLAGAPRLTLDDQILLHEIRDGLTLRNASIAEQWRNALHIESLPVMLAAQRLNNYGARRANAEQFAAAGEAQSAHWCMREALEELLAAYLAAFGCTNPRKRWHLLLLERLDHAAQATALAMQLAAPLLANDLSEQLKLADAVQLEIASQQPVLERLGSLLTHSFERGTE
jgi:hypothetical protein